MPNKWESSWAEFFGKHRLQAILDEDRRTNGRDAEIEQLGKECVEIVVPRLLGALESGGNSIERVLVHGDLLASFDCARLIVDGVGMLVPIWIPGNPSFMILVHSTRTTNTRLGFRRFSRKMDFLTERCLEGLDRVTFRHIIILSPSLHLWRSMMIASSCILCTPSALEISGS